jgi:hypothetical protein
MDAAIEFVPAGLHTINMEFALFCKRGANVKHKTEISKKSFWEIKKGENRC